ncbi:MAG: Nif3-like dinuclear metal center hexameric protein [Clostridia bacterium]|nr:Nif3-like dinuclear metal center hexameric protein [Clostridia bacterium]
MVRISQIIKSIENYAPISIAEDYDNCGLKIGNTDQNVIGVLVTLDTNIDVVEEAKRKSCNLIVEHHPSIWKPLKTIDLRIPLNSALIGAAKAGIAVYSAHTNIDFAPGGLNDVVAKKIGLLDCMPLDGLSSPRLGFLDKSYTLREYAKLISAAFADDNVSTIGDLEKNIRKVAVINGGGGGSEEIIWDTYKAGCDVFVTGEVKHNVARLAKNLNYAIIQVGHYTSEAEFMPLMKKILLGDFPDVPVFCTDSIGSPYNRRCELWN